MHTHIFYLNNLNIPNGVDPVATPHCALYTSEIIRSTILADERKDGNGPTRYGKAKVTCY
jgi:hypothetical protein